MAMFERQIRSGSSELTVYSPGTDTIVVHVLDNDTFNDGTHNARIELPISEFRKLVAGIDFDTIDENKRFWNVEDSK